MKGHVVITAVAGRASLTIHERVDLGPLGGACVPVVSVMLEPADVLALATELTQASIPPPPVVRRRLKVRSSELGLWFFECPECFGITGSWVHQQDALAAAYRHLEREHASEETR